MDYYTGVLKKYADFSGRARRAEFWMFALINFLISIGIGIVEAIIGTAGAVGGTGIIGTLYSLAVFIPSLAVSVRRLHDTNRSGWWLLLAFIPILGWIALLIFYIQDSDPGDNKYGPNPKGVPGPAATGVGGGSPAAGVPATDQRLQDLETLRTRGLITDAEYEEKRKEIIGSV